MAVANQDEVIEGIRGAFKSHRETAKRGRRYPVHLRQLVKEAAKSGIEREKLLEASGVPNLTLSKWLPRPRKKNETQTGFTRLEIIDSSPDIPVTVPSSVGVFTYPSGVKLELPVDILSLEVLVSLGVLSS